MAPTVDHTPWTSSSRTMEGHKARRPASGPARGKQARGRRAAQGSATSFEARLAADSGTVADLFTSRMCLSSGTSAPHFPKRCAFPQHRDLVFEATSTAWI